MDKPVAAGIAMWKQILDGIDNSAAVVDTMQWTIVAANRKFTAGAGGEVVFSPPPRLADEAVGLVALANPRGLAMSAAANSAADEFKIFPVLPGLGLLLEIGGALDDIIEPVRADGAPMHITYMRDIGRGAWSFANPANLYSFGLLAEGVSLENFDWRQVIAADDLPLYDSVVARAEAGGGQHEIRYRLKTDKGLLEVRDFCGVTLDAERRPTLVGSVVVANLPLDKVRRAERQMLAGRLVGGMVHDFKNLLTGMQNILEWCASRPETNPEIGEALRKTVGYSAQAAKLISGVLRVSAGKDADKVEKFKLGELILEQSDLLRRLLPASTRLEIRVGDNLPPMFGRPGQIQDLLLNLCVNARDAMCESGERLLIEAAAKVVSAGAGGASEFITLRVEDDGCGMDAAAAAGIFDAFHSTKDTGTGFGLWMAREIVHSFDGKISVSSEPGKGTRFDIVFPAAGDIGGEDDSPAPAAVSAPIVDSELNNFVFPRPRRVLFIEDDPLIRGGVAAWLESWGLDVAEAADGLEGLRLFRQEPNGFNLILQDFVLPGVRGDELMKIFAAESPGTPVVLTTANADDSLPAGEFHFLRKPFRMGELLAILRDLLA